jgi:1-acyl-sn-glycerol-3-phosphate acyltransferase
MRTLLVFIGIPFVTVAYSVAVMLHMALFRDPEVFYRYARSWSRVLLKLAGIHVTRITSSTTTSLTASPSHHPTIPLIYAANHASLFDIPVLLAYLPDNVRIIYKRELERIPVFGWGLRMSPFIAVDRAKAREASDAIDSTAATIRQGASALVFPEGTRSKDGTLGTFRRGVVNLAVKAGIAIRPVVLRGTAAIMPARTLRIRSGTVDLVLLDPITVDGITTRDQERALLEQLRNVMEEQLTSRHDR